MKKIVVFLLCLTLLCPAAALAADPVTELWAPSLRAAEAVYGGVLWALDYVDAYLADPNWENLTMAKAACLLTADHLQSYDFPVLSLSDEELAALAGEGFEVVILTEYTLPQGEAQDLCFMLRQYLFPAFEQYNITPSERSSLQSTSAMMRKYVDYLCTYTCITLNAYALPQFENDGAEDFWQGLHAAYPLLFSYAQPWNDSMDAINAANEQLYNDEQPLENWILEVNRAISVIENEMFDAQHGRELEKPLPIPGAPAMLLTPLWHDPYTAEYRVTDARFGDALTPEGCSLQFTQSGVPLASLEEYMALMETCAQSIQRTDNRWIIQMDTYSVDVGWQSDTVTFRFGEESSTFASDVSLLTVR